VANMLTKSILVLIPVLLAATVQGATAEETPVAEMPHPRDAALIQQPDGGWSYRKFPEGSRLYVFEGDSPGQSSCNSGCASTWPPLFVSPGADSVGAWTVILRDDGKPQWAYKGQPVYRRYHDMQLDTEQLEEAGFRILEP
jgi:predicted lipoprotein with Yx(FWY)xxD motif